MEDDRGDTPLIVKVDDGKCSDRTFAAAIQVIYKEIASKAILKAETAMKNAGIDLEVDPSTNTIDFAWGQYSNALGNYFNITDFKSLPPGSRYEKLEEVFNEGGCGILMDETHMVCAVEYENGIFTYYDSTTGQYDTGYAGEFKELILLERK